MHDAEAGTLRWLLALAAVLLCPPVVLAQAALPEILYEAPAPCPTREAFIARLRARSADTPARPPNTRRFEVRLALRAGHAIGQLRVLAIDGALSQRQIEAATCDEAADAVALIAALTLTPAPPSPEPTQPPRSKRTASPNSPSAPISPPDSAPESTPASPPARAATSAPAPAPESESESESDSESGSESDSVSDSESESESDSAPLQPSRLSLFLSALATTGISPSLLPALQLSTALVAQLGPAELALRLAFRATPEDVTTRAEGRAQFAFLGGLAALCAGPRLADGHAALWGCFAFEPGRISAEATFTRDPQPSSRFWAALGPGLLGQWDLIGPLALQLGAELLFPLVRDRYFLADTAVHRTPSLVFRAELGLGLQIR